MNRLLQATSIVAAAGITWAAWHKIYDNYTWRMSNQERYEQRVETQTTIDDTLKQMWACLDENMQHNDSAYGMNWMYGRILSECIPLYSIFKSYPFTFNAEVAKQEFNSIMSNNPEFFERLKHDIELLKDEWTLRLLQRYRSHMTTPVWLTEPYDIENDPEGFCQIAACDIEHVRDGFTWDQAWKNFDGVYMIVKEEYATAYNLVGMFQRNGMDYSYFSGFIEEMINTSE